MEHEHKKLLTGIQQMKQLLVAKVNTTESNGRDEINKHADKVVKNATSKFLSLTRFYFQQWNQQEHIDKNHFVF